MKYADAERLLAKYVSGETLWRHSRAVAAVLECWARDAGADDPETWRCVGLLHDIDFERYPEQHCVKARELLEAEKAAFPGISDGLIHAVQSHGWNICCSVEPVLLMEKVLYTVDELTGLVYACALMRPSKSVSDLEAKSVLKKFKTPAFAAGCSRSVIQAGCLMLGAELVDVVERTIRALRGEASLLGV
jgi:predicted hydrolase (HD superfamily)